MKGIRYPSLEQVERLHNRVLDVTGGEHGDLSRSNLEYVLEAVKQIGGNAGDRHAVHLAGDHRGADRGDPGAQA